MSQVDFCTKSGLNCSNIDKTGQKLSQWNSQDENRPKLCEGEFFIFCTKMGKMPKTYVQHFFRPQKPFSSEFNGNCSLGSFGCADHIAAIRFELARFLFEIWPPQGCPVQFCTRSGLNCSNIDKTGQNCHNGIVRMRTDANCGKQNFSFFAPKWKICQGYSLSVFSTPKNFFFRIQRKLLSRGIWAYR